VADRDPCLAVSVSDAVNRHEINHPHPAADRNLRAGSASGERGTTANEADAFFGNENDGCYRRPARAPGVASRRKFD
jgi:hypothetical protein